MPHFFYKKLRKRVRVNQQYSDRSEFNFTHQLKYAVITYIKINEWIGEVVEGTQLHLSFFLY